MAVCRKVVLEGRGPFAVAPWDERHRHEGTSAVCQGKGANVWSAAAAASVFLAFHIKPSYCYILFWFSVFIMTGA